MNHLDFEYENESLMLDIRITELRLNYLIKNTPEFMTFIISHFFSDAHPSVSTYLMMFYPNEYLYPTTLYQYVMHFKSCVASEDVLVRISSFFQSLNIRVLNSSSLQSYS